MKYTSPGDLVFDPYVGYGTTLSVAKRFNRNAIGTEINQNKIKFLSEEFVLNKEIFLDNVQDFINKMNVQISETKENGNYGYGYDHSYCLIFLRT